MYVHVRYLPDLHTRSSNFSDNVHSQSFSCHTLAVSRISTHAHNNSDIVTSLLSLYSYHHHTHSSLITLCHSCPCVSEWLNVLATEFNEKH